jgi:hypothetical protein
MRCLVSGVLTDLLRINEPAIIRGMRRRSLIFIAVLWMGLACQLISQPLAGFLHAKETPTALIYASVSPDVGTPISPATLTVSPVVTVTSQAAGNFVVHIHPDGDLYVGDQVSLEIISPPGLDMSNKEVYVHVEGPQGNVLGPAKFEAFGIAGRRQATLYWAWNTKGLETGEHELTFSIQPTGQTWEQTVTLLPANLLPSPEPQAHWATSESECCNVYYITGTASERDLAHLLQIVDAQAESVSQALNYTSDKPTSVVFVPRVMGQGGFTSQEISVSYLDRNYIGSGLDIVLHHELVHLFDERLGGEYKPTLFLEGLAVYLSGGHLKAEPLLPRAAALLDLGWYLPLDSLFNNFYQAQHDIGYLEAGALIEFMVKTWGWQAFSSFYRDIHPPAQGEGQIMTVDRAFLTHFQLPLAGIEEHFLSMLHSQQVSPETIADVRMTVSFYDSVRRYQQALDPSAYFLTAWMLDGQQLRQRGIVADYLRHPSASENLALETMLLSAGTYLRDGNYSQVQRLTDAIVAVMDAMEKHAADPFKVHPLAADYFGIVEAVAKQGYQIQRIQMEDKTALVWTYKSGFNLWELRLSKNGSEWVVTQVSA